MAYVKLCPVALCRAGVQPDHSMQALRETARTPRRREPRQTTEIRQFSTLAVSHFVRLALCRPWIVAYTVVTRSSRSTRGARGERVDMPDLGYYAAKIEECRRLLESSPDQLYRDVYQAMADEFAEKYASLRRRSAEPVAAPPSPLLHQMAMPGVPELAAPPEAVLPGPRAAKRGPATPATAVPASAQPRNSIVAAR